MMHHKTAFIAVLDSVLSAQKYIKTVREKAGTFNYELIIAVREPLPTMLEQSEGCKIFYVPITEEAEIYKVRNIARYLISSDSALLLFLDKLPKELSETWLRNCTIPFSVEPIITGVSGVKGAPVSTEIEHQILHRLKTFIHIDEANFKECCCVDNKLYYVEENGACMSVRVWDYIGGYAILSPFPHLEYCARVSALRHIIYITKEINA